MPEAKAQPSVVDWGESSKQNPYITIQQMEAICQEVVAAKSVSSVGYQPTAPQVFFFTLVRTAKQTKKKQQATPDTPVAVDWRATSRPLLTAVTMRNLAGTVAQHLADWGSVVYSLQQRDNKEWELLRILMENAIKGFSCPQATKDDALHDALLKIFQLLDALPLAQQLQMTADMFAFFVAHQTSLTGVYDFYSPFYAYAQLIARNTLFYELRRSQRAPIYPIPWDDLTDEAIVQGRDEVAEAEEREEKAGEQEAHRQQLGMDLARLFTLLETYMQTQQKRRLVVWHTLAARSQYWLALALTGLTPPMQLPPTPQASDADIAQTLGMTANNVRVQRKKAKSQIEELDIACGELLEMLMDIDESNALQWWPKN